MNIQNKKIFPSMILALFINTSLINTALNAVFEQSIMQYIYIGIAAMVFINVFFNFKYVSIHLSTVCMASVLIGYYFFSYSSTYIEPVYFIVYILLPALMSLMIFDEEKTLRYIIICSIPVILASGKMFELREIHDDISMGMTYAFLPCVCASIVHYKYFRKTAPKYMYIGYLIDMYYLLQLVLYGSRGPILAVAVLLVIMLIYDYDVKGSLRVNLALAVFLVSIVTVIALNFVNILRLIQSFFASYDISFVFIDKIIRLDDIDNMSNGRMMLFELAFKLFLRAPLIGHGISTFPKYTNYVYPHNSILQFLFDGGLILTFIVVGMFIGRSVKNLKKTDIYGFTFYIFLFFTSVPTSMVTGDIFENSIFWLLVFMLMNNKFIKEDKSKEKSVAIEGSPYTV